MYFLTPLVHLPVKYHWAKVTYDQATKVILLLSYTTVSSTIEKCSVFQLQVVFCHLVLKMPSVIYTDIMHKKGCAKTLIQQYIYFLDIWISKNQYFQCFLFYNIYYYCSITIYYYTIYTIQYCQINWKGNFKLNCFGSICLLNDQYREMWCMKITQTVHSNLHVFTFSVNHFEYHRMNRIAMYHDIIVSWCISYCEVLANIQS